MFTLANRFRKDSMGKSVLVYGGVSLFCQVFYRVYDIFSHGVRSAYMTWLWAFPAAFGVIPCLLLFMVSEKYRPGRIAVNIYHSGIAAMTVSSLLRGIFEIAGTGSAYQELLMHLGFGMTVFGILCYIFCLAAGARKGKM